MLTQLYDDHIRTQRARTDEALAACGFESLAIYAGAAHMRFLDDQPYAFKPNPHFRLWTPLADPRDCWILYRPGQRLQLIFLQPRDYWHQPPQTPADFWTTQFEITTIRERQGAKEHVERLPRCAFIGESHNDFEQWGFAELNPPALLNRLHFTRAVKTTYEIECMRRASARAANGHHAAESAFRSGGSEYEIHLEYLRATNHTDDELPYPSIVAVNRHAAVLHYQHLDRGVPALSERRSFLIDAGAEFNGYACDVTRTYSYADDEFGALIEGMHKLQQALCAQVRPSVDYASIHLEAHHRIAALLHDTGVLRCNADEAVATRLSSVFFPHGVGHLLGLQVHDVGGFTVGPDGSEKARPEGHPYLRLTRSLAPGFVVTIEPGVYFIDALLDEARASKHAALIDWDAVARLHPCGGIRIEDDVACMDSEPENLTRLAFAARA